MQQNPNWKVPTKNSVDANLGSSVPEDGRSAPQPRRPSGRARKASPDHHAMARGELTLGLSR